MSQLVRTRFAPSPTGRMHVGNLRTALYAWLIARHAGGEFLLRIEDTDQERLVEGATDIIYRTMKATGLNHDEGPDLGGPVGPYVQSERVRAGIYRKYAEELVEKGEAYYCFCTHERLESLKQGTDEKSFASYDKHCLHLTKEEVEENLRKGLPYVIRQNNPTEGVSSFEDEIYGHIEVENKELDDMILIKSDGFPTYNFANVVDDHLMGITHVVRGNEYLSSAPKYNRLYEAFGWEIPVYVHCPLITDESHKKLSKRSGHSSFEDLLEQGFLADAIVNFIALLGWSHEDGKEVMTREELISSFDYRRISKSPAVFDMTKLRWMNGEYIHAMKEEDFLRLAEPILKDCLGEGFPFDKICRLVQGRIETLKDMEDMVSFFRSLNEDYSLELFLHKKMKSTYESSLQILTDLIPRIEALPDVENSRVFAVLDGYAKETQRKLGQVIWPVRTALSGLPATPGGATEILEVIGKEEGLRRLKLGRERLTEIV